MCTQCDLHVIDVYFKRLSTENDCDTTNPKPNPKPNFNPNPDPIFNFDPKTNPNSTPTGWSS